MDIADVRASLTATVALVLLFAPIAVRAPTG
jgi:hypothetical protein